MLQLKSCLAVALCLVMCSLPAYAALIDRGNGLIYDDVLDITWLQDAGMGPTTDWSAAADWVANLEYQGYSDWRLPSISLSDGVPVNCRLSTTSELECQGNELGYMFYYNLMPAGQTWPGAEKLWAADVPNFADLTGNTAPFQNISALGIWSSTVSSDSYWAMIFGFGWGLQNWADTNGFLPVWAVRSGDSSVTVPAPSTLLLFAAGLVALGWGAKRRATKTSVLR